jgi:hypothetical protein
MDGRPCAHNPPCKARHTSTVCTLQGGACRYMMWGISGAFLSVPIMSVIKIFCQVTLPPYRHAPLPGTHPSVHATPAAPNASDTDSAMNVGYTGCMYVVAHREGSVCIATLPCRMRTLYVRRCSQAGLPVCVWYSARTCTTKRPSGSRPPWKVGAAPALLSTPSSLHTGRQITADCTY